jgi:hypothetical protein
MKILELFSGTGSLGKGFSNALVTSVDVNPRFDPTFLCDIMDFDYKQFDSFDYIHASPPCTEYSINQASFYGRRRRVGGILTDFNPDVHETQLKEADALVLKAIEIIDHFKPACWTIENPYSNWRCSLKQRPFMSEYDFTRVDYFMYTDPVLTKKPTMFFNNFGLKLSLCDKNHDHLHWDKLPGGGGNPYTRHVIPHRLCVEIAKQVTDVVYKHT